MLKILLVHPGASWSTADVEAGLRFGLEEHGVHVIPYRLDTRIAHTSRFMHMVSRLNRRKQKDAKIPNFADCLYQASAGVIERALRYQVNVVFLVSAMYFHPDILVLLKRAGLRVVILFTESPYDLENELLMAQLADGCWTMERSCVSEFQRAQPNSGYLPHAWHPKRHRPEAQEGDADVPSHDVVFVGSSFRERLAWFRSIDWTGIDLGLYGLWDLADDEPLKTHLKIADAISNDFTAALYRRAKIGLNLYRKSQGFGEKAPFILHAESMNPRGYELAACGAFHLSDYRAEVVERFNGHVPTFRTSDEAVVLIRQWLNDNDGRKRIAADLPVLVEGSSWTDRAATVLSDLKSLYSERTA